MSTLSAVSAAMTAPPSRCSTSGVLTLSDASQITGCTTFTGYIALPTDGSLQTNGGVFEGPGDLTDLDGNLYVEDIANLTRLSFPSLKTSHGRICLGNLPHLDKLDLSNLTFTKNLTLVDLPSISSDHFQLGPEIDFAYGLVIHNTSLSSIDSFNYTQYSFDLSLVNNTKLFHVNLSITKLGNLIIKSNGTPMKIELPDLVEVSTLEFSQVSEIDMPSFSGQSGLIQISDSQISNLHMDSVTWLDEVRLRNNSDLRSVSLKSLEIVGNGDLDIIGSPQVSSVDLTSLKLVTRAFNISGNFTNLDLHNLNTVWQNIDIESSQDVSDFCDALKKKDIITYGKTYKCEGAGNGKHKSSSLSTGAKAGIGVGVAGGVVFIASLVAYFFVTKRRKNKHAAIKTETATEEQDSP